MPTQNVVITEHQADLIEKLVDSGKYQNASEVLREGLRLIEMREIEYKAKLKILREAVQVGIEDVEAGRYHEFATVKQLRAYLKSLAQKAKAARARRNAA